MIRTPDSKMGIIQLDLELSCDQLDDIYFLMNPILFAHSLDSIKATTAMALLLIISHITVDNFQSLNIQLSLTSSLAH